ncbi:MAG: hypothetical protein V9G10_13355 [Candidatus Nanopelagicales bacterium]
MSGDVGLGVDARRSTITNHAAAKLQMYWPTLNSQLPQRLALQDLRQRRTEPA